ncbi:hypothetical protein MSAN_01114700 [Mycena sanguinolenta]|uniref:Transmembrane protein n=1 Tax=Mycena sanguinolenta TaxID=230812 RepID=A0A8H7D6Q2_9AGAR|nr:hypothetical protein MSAN_01114700 [Mycena sanguinolenta]
MAMPLIWLLCELLLAFCTSSLIVLVLLRAYTYASGSAFEFPLVQTLAVTSFCTLLVFAGMRKGGYLWPRRGDQEFVADGETADVEFEEGSDKIRLKPMKDPQMTWI